MQRPTILIATTAPLMAAALRTRLRKQCLDLGLKLETCPEGEKRPLGDEPIRVYSSADQLFDALEARGARDLADTLVVVDLGSLSLRDAFGPVVHDRNPWKVPEGRAGVALELVLRFPQAFPVFLSPEVPLRDPPAVPPDPEWNSFSSLRDQLTTLDEPLSSEEGQGAGGIAAELFNDVTTKLHFASPLAPELLDAAVKRFAAGMRCWFDPAGLRTLVRNRLLGTVFGDRDDWSNTQGKNGTGQRAAQLRRLDAAVVAVDEEREFAMFNAYAAWKYGRRAWMVTTCGEFEQGLWIVEPAGDVVVLRDVDLRFPDVPVEDSIREQLTDIHGDAWDRQDRGGWREKNSWNARVVTGEAKARTRATWRASRDESRLGQEKTGDRDERWYSGFQKPVGTIYDLSKSLGPGATVARATVLGELGTASDGGGTRHGAPYVNLAMAESLLRQARRAGDGSEPHLIGALLASEAFELLLGMSKTTALEALLEVHRAEVRAEVSFVGVHEVYGIRERRHDLHRTLEALYRGSGLGSKARRVQSIYLSEIWGDLRILYRDGERFTAAESANRLSLSYSFWPPLPWLGPKRGLVWLGTRIIGLAVSAVLLTFISTLLYAGAAGWEFTGWGLEELTRGFRQLWPLWHSVLMSSMAMEVLGELENLGGDDSLSVRLVQIFHVGSSFVLFGLLIAALYRKITRS